MVRRVFFSFRYKNDIWRVSNIRNSQKFMDIESKGFIDGASWEQLKKKGDSHIKTWIDNEIIHTSVTVVLIGSETSSSKWVKYEIIESEKRGNGIIGIYIHNVKDSDGFKDKKGLNPIERLYNNREINNMYKTYDWVLNNGRENIGVWIEQAAKEVGR